MSQIPQMEPTNNYPRPRYNIGLPTGPSVGIQGSMPIADLPVAGDQSAAQYAGALGLFERDVTLAADLKYRNEQRAEADAAKQERAQLKAENIQNEAMRKAATQTGLETLPAELDAIKTGKSALLDPANKSYELAVNNWVKQHSAGMGDAYEQELDRVVSRPLLAGLYGKQEADTKNALNVALKGATDRYANTVDPDQLDKVDEQIRQGTPHATQEQINSSLAKAMLIHAQANRPDMVEAIQKKLAGSEEKMQQQATSFLETAQKADQVRRNGQFENDALTAISDAIRPDSGVTFSDAILDVRNSGRLYGIEPRVVEAKVIELQKMENEQTKQVESQAAKQKVLLDKRNELSSSVSTHVQAAIASVGTPDQVGNMGGLSHPLFADKIHFNEVPGMSIEDQKKFAAGDIRSRFNIDFNNFPLDQSPQGQANVQKMRLYQQALTSSGIDDGELDNRLKNLTFNDQSKDAVNPNNLAAARLYSVMSQTNAPYAKSRITGNENAQIFYDVYNDAVSHNRCDEQQAVLLAQRAAADPESYKTASTKIFNLASTATEGKYSQRALANVVSNAKNILMGNIGLTPEDAVKSAVDEARGGSVKLWQSNWKPEGRGWSFFPVPRWSSGEPLAELGPMAMLTGNSEELRGDAAKGFEEIIKARLREAKSKHPGIPYEDDGTDLTVIHEGGGSWRIVGNGIPFTNPDGAINTQIDMPTLLAATRAATLVRAGNEKQLPSESELLKQIADTKDSMAPALDTVRSLTRRFHVPESRADAYVYGDKLNSLTAQLEARRFIDLMNKGGSNKP